MDFGYSFGPLAQYKAIQDCRSVEMRRVRGMGESNSRSEEGVCVLCFSCLIGIEKVVDSSIPFVFFECNYLLFEKNISKM